MDTKEKLKLSEKCLVLENVKKSYESVIKSVNSFLNIIKDKQRKTSNINGFAKNMINTVSDLFQELYDICPELQQQHPAIQDGKQLNNILTSLYEATTLPKLQSFLFLLDLLKVVFTSFINEIEKSNNLLTSKEIIEKSKKIIDETEMLQKKIDHIDDESLFEYDQDKNEYKISYEVENYLKNFKSNIIYAGIKEENLKIILKNDQYLESIEKQIKKKFPNFISKIKIEVESTSIKKKLHKINNDSTSGTIGLIARNSENFLDA